MKLSKRLRWILGVICLLVIPIAFVWVNRMAGTAVPFTGDLMDWKARYLAGFRGTNCGRVKIGADPTKATRCALDAYAAGRPFRVAYNFQGFDSQIAGGIVRTSRGKLQALSYDSCPMGCGFSLTQQRVQVAACPEPYYLYVSPKGRANCFQPPQNLMSPNFEPY